MFNIMSLTSKLRLLKRLSQYSQVALDDAFRSKPSQLNDALSCISLYDKTEKQNFLQVLFT